MGERSRESHQQNSSQIERVHEVFSTMDGTKLTLRYINVQFQTAKKKRTDHRKDWKPNGFGFKSNEVNTEEN